MLANKYATAGSEFEEFGDIASIGVPVTAGIVSLVKGDQEGFWLLAKGALYTAGATHALKFSFNATRPDGGEYSFPSGHTSAAMQGATYLSQRYGAMYGIPAYITTALVGYSRVKAKRHYWHDVIVGGVLAYGIQHWIMSEAPKYVEHVELYPTFNRDYMGVAAVMHF
ncbi:phosphatase PAP2 family protein [Photobacterium damselae]|uniref:phosphatase PAP2 family protein n=1 Tax=Photobacterium damselae TaxID=38293 RepID=UPI004069725F